jgi:uncharacterized protein (AIM24 family)
VAIMALPVIHPQSITNGEAPGVKFNIDGSLVPALHLSLDGSVPVMFEHHVILWKQPQIDVQMMKMKGAFKRVIAGMQIFMTQAVGTGEIAFSRDNPGQLFPISLQPGERVLVREHQFLAATLTGEYSYERVKGIGSMLFGSQGFFVDTFSAGSQGMTLWLHAHGNAFDLDLAAGETIDVEPGAWIYRDPSVGYEQKVFGLKTGLLGGGGNLVFNRFTGPGRVGLQSGFYTGEAGAMAGGAAGAAGGGLKGGLGGLALGGILGSMLDN